MNASISLMTLQNHIIANETTNSANSNMIVRINAPAYQNERVHFAFEAKLVRIAVWELSLFFKRQYQHDQNERVHFGTCFRIKMNAFIFAAVFQKQTLKPY